MLINFHFDIDTRKSFVTSSLVNVNELHDEGRMTDFLLIVVLTSNLSASMFMPSLQFLKSSLHKAVYK